MHEQGGGHVVAAALVEQPGAQGVGQLLGGRRAQSLERGQGAGPEVGEGRLVGVQDQPGELRLGVELDAELAGAERAIDRRADLQPRYGGTCDRGAVAQRAQQRRTPVAVGVRDEEQCALVQPGASVAWMVPAASRPSTGRTCDSGTSTAVSVVGGAQPAASAAAATASSGAPATSRAATLSSSRWRTRPVVSVSSVCPATAAADSSSM